ncbi:MAG: trypsin-like peptidase domain-containing protein [Planctomycetaceae bacterium]|jgi:S1-C subfamily serine protease|nr:trypsin-like peptidase domain-containing protein [Planctomycetaceae bacterium]
MAQQWYYLNASNEKVGPLSAKALKTLADNGIITPGTALQLDGAAKTVEANAVKGLFTPQTIQVPRQPQTAYSPPGGFDFPDLTSQGQTPDGYDPFAAAKAAQASQYTSRAASYGGKKHSFWSSLPSQVGTVLVSLLVVAGLCAKVARPFLRAAREKQNTVVADINEDGKRIDEIFDRINTKILPADEENQLVDEGCAIAEKWIQSGKKNGLFHFWFGMFKLGKGDCDGAIAEFNKGISTPFQYVPAQDADMCKQKMEEFKTSIPLLQKRVANGELSRVPRLSELMDIGRTGITPRDLIGDGRPKPRQQHSPPPVNSPPVKDQPIKDETAKKTNKGRLSTEDIVADVENSVALIQGKEGSGSGFVVLPGILVTNYHVIGSEFINELEIFFPSEEGGKHGPFNAELLYCNDDRDIAFLKLNTKEHKPLAIVDDYRFRRGQDVIAIGSPGRGDGEVLENAVSKGVLSSQTKMDGCDYYQLSIAVNPGNSGGPVFNDEGFVIGVVTLKSTETEAMAFCIPPNELREKIELVRKGDGKEIQASRSLHDRMVYCNRGVEKIAALKELADAPADVRQKFVNEGFSDFENAVQRAPDNPLAHFGRGIFKVCKEDINGGLADMDKSIELAKQHTPDMTEKYTEVRDKLREEIAKAGGGGRRIMAGEGFMPRMMPSMPSIPPPMQRPPVMPPPPPGLHQRPNPADRFAGRMPFGRGVDNTGDGPPQVRPELTEEQKKMQAEMQQRALEARKSRYDKVVAKENWTFNGKPLKGTLVGYDDKEGMAKFKLKDTGEEVERYASRFSLADISDIRTYAMHNGISIRNLMPRR